MRTKIGQRIIEAAIRARVAGVIEKQHTIDVYLGRLEHGEFREQEMRGAEMIRRETALYELKDYIEWSGFRVFRVEAKTHFGVGLVGIP
jgi:hypothetical protein